MPGCTSSAFDQKAAGTAEGGAEETPTEESTFAGEETVTPLKYDGLVTVEREASVEAVVAAVSGAIEANEKLTLMTTVDHAENAATVGRSLPPPTLSLFGNPALGTRLMNERRSVAIDLPQKILVYGGEEGTVVYNDPTYLARRHEIAGKEGSSTQSPVRSSRSPTRRSNRPRPSRRASTRRGRSRSPSGRQ